MAEVEVYYERKIYGNQTISVLNINPSIMDLKAIDSVYPLLLV